MYIAIIDNLYEFAVDSFLFLQVQLKQKLCNLLDHIFVFYISNIRKSNRIESGKYSYHRRDHYIPTKSAKRFNYHKIIVSQIFNMIF